ncbi:hypothetical protein Plhal304r1_c066g0154011 [Plasmopara halstedii]
MEEALPRTHAQRIGTNAPPQSRPIKYLAVFLGDFKAATYNSIMYFTVLQLMYLGAFCKSVPYLVALATT